MSTARIAFATFEGAPALDHDDVIAATALRARDATVEATVWSDPAVAWERFDLVVIRSTWDYHQRAPEFVAWLKRLHRAGVHVCNPIPTMIWNMDKRYLLELAGKGVPIVPTHRLERGSKASLEDVLRQQGWANAVVKPAVSVNSFGTFRVSQGDAARKSEAWQALLRASDVLVQPFVQEILDEGEWSLLFFDGQFSHALIKRPGTNDFRTQSAFGGTHTRAAAPGELSRQAHAVLEAANMPHVYARVDGVVVNRQFQLMELELIEPSLYLDDDRAAADRFADVLLQRVRPR